MLALAAGSLALVAPKRAQAQSQDAVQDTVVVPTDWALIPSGLGPGDEFRLLYVTSATRTGIAGSIATYNGFVQRRLSTEGHTALRAYASLSAFRSRFRAVASTSAVDARDNIGMNPNDPANRDVPVYWLNGPRVAAGTAGFWSISWEHWGAFDCRQEDGEDCDNWVTGAWTGSNADGTKHANYLGKSPSVRYGSLAVQGNTQNPISKGNASRTEERALLGMSPVFRVDDGTVWVGEGGASASFSYTLADHISQPPSKCREMEAFAGSGMKVRRTSGSPDFGLRTSFRLCAADWNVPHSFEVRAVDDGWDVPGIWRQPGNTGDTYTSEVRIYEVDAGPDLPLVESVTVPVTIVDNDPPMVNLSGGAAVTEGGAASFTITATSPPSSALTVRYRVRQGEPFVIHKGDVVADAELGAKSVLLPAGALSATFTVPTVGDSVDEADGMVRVTLESGSGYKLVAPVYQEVAVVDDDPATKGSDLGNPGGGDTEDVELQDEPGTPEDDGESEVPEVPEPDGGEDPSPVVLDGDAPAAECGSADALAAEARANHDALANTASNRKERNDWWRAWIALSGKTGTYNTPLTAAEARLLESGDARWAPFRKALECAEGDPQPTPDGGEDPSPVVLDGDAPAAECGSADALAVQARANHDALRNTWWNRRERNDWWRAWIALSGKTGTHNAPLTAAEARLLETGDTRWAPFRKALECVEGAPAQP